MLASSCRTPLALRCAPAKQRTDATTASRGVTHVLRSRPLGEHSAGSRDVSAPWEGQTGRRRVPGADQPCTHGDGVASALVLVACVWARMAELGWPRRIHRGSYPPARPGFDKLCSDVLEARRTFRTAKEPSAICRGLFLVRPFAAPVFNSRDFAAFLRPSSGLSNSSVALAIC
jgi:hypothetical protein